MPVGQQPYIYQHPIATQVQQSAQEPVIRNKQHPFERNRQHQAQQPTIKNRQNPFERNHQTPYIANQQ